MKISILIKKRLKTINNIGKITKALEMVATSKIQKAKKEALDSKLFAKKIYDLVHSFTLEPDLPSNPFLRIPKHYKSGLYILITTNKGLCGSLNTNLFRFLDDFINMSKLLNHEFITIGGRGRNFANRRGNLVADFSESPPVDLLAPSLVKIIRNRFMDNKADVVYFIYNDFVSVFTQQPRARKILPLIFEETQNLQPDSLTQVNKQIKLKNYTFEPSIRAVLNKILFFYLKTQIAEVILHSYASEHAARMMAMRNASDNAIKLSQNLYLEFNKARQQAITAEINDMVATRIFG